MLLAVRVERVRNFLKVEFAVNHKVSRKNTVIFLNFDNDNGSELCVYAVRAIERVPAGSCHFLCLADPSQSVVSFPCVRKWEHIKAMCASIARRIWDSGFETRDS